MDPDDDEARRAEYERLFGTTEQREAEQREMDERKRALEREELLAWCEQRAEARIRAQILANAGPPVMKAAPNSLLSRANSSAPAVVRSPDRVNWAKVVGELMAEHEIETRKQFAEHAQRIAELERELNDLITRQRAYADMDEMRDRLKRLEAIPRGQPLKAIG